MLKLLPTMLAMTIMFGCSGPAHDHGATQHGEDLLAERQDMGKGVFITCREKLGGLFFVSSNPLPTELRKLTEENKERLHEEMEKPELLEVWQWQATGIERALVAEIPNVFEIVLYPDDRYLTRRYLGRGSTWQLGLAKPGVKGDVKTWEPQRQWKGRNLAISPNGKHAAVAMQADLELVLPDGKVGAATMQKMQIGTIDVDHTSLDVVAELSTTERGEVREMAVSNDGGYIALGAWNNGITVIDVAQRKVLWKLSRTPVDYVRVSPDGTY